MSPRDGIWQLFIKGLQGKTTTLDIHQDASIDDLIRKISDQTGIKTGELRVIYAGKQLEYGQNKLLTDYRIQNNSTLFIVLRLLGGSTIDDDPPPKVLDDDVELTDAPDMITWDEDPENRRAKMPCGHAITPESLTAYCRSLLTSGKFRFYCPYINRENGVYCGREWEYVVVRRLAVLSLDEKKEFEEKISNNYLQKALGIQECPKCHSYCERFKKTDRRLVCPICSKQTRKTFEFCWFCLHEWKKDSLTDCGNVDCSGEDPRLKILRDCSRKEIVSGLKNCPSIRACPNCGMLIQHVKMCKHMSCICGQKFCFICLKLPDSSGNYRCGTYNSKCTIAAVQTTIPGD